MARHYVALAFAVTLAVGALPTPALAEASAHPVSSYARIHIGDRVVLGRRVLVPITIDCVGAPAGATLEAGLVQIFQDQGGDEPVISYGGWGAADCDGPPVRRLAALDRETLRPGRALVDVFYTVELCTPTCTTLEDGGHEESARLVRPRRHAGRPLG